MFKQNFIIGNTPMIKINYKYKGQNKQIFAKLEYYNLTGSIKDRVAFYMINNAKENGNLKEKMPLIEATSGNTGISLSALGAYYKHPVYIYMPDWVSKERMQLMKSYGANLFLISKEDGGFLKCLEEAKKLAQKINGLFTNQFSNKDNFLAHYETTGKEILNQISEPINGFVSGVGTGGTLMGIGQKLKEKYPNLIVTAIEPDKMPLISQGKILDQHKIEGIGDDFIPDLIDKNKMNICDIDISNITDQYIQYLNAMEELDLEIASEFVIMASTLLYLKSKTLLPVLENVEEEEKELTEEELLRRIIEYKKYKEVSEKLKEFYAENSKRFYKEPEKIKFPKKELELDSNYSVIVKAYTKVIEKNKKRLNQNAKNIQKIAITDTYTVGSKVKEMYRELIKHDKFVFNNLFSQKQCNKVEVVTAFTGLLEMSRRSKVQTSQQNLFGDILVEKHKRNT